MNKLEMIRLTKIILSVVFLLLATIGAVSEPLSIEKAKTPESKGLAIAKEVDLRGMGYEDVKTDLTMILINQLGQENIRYLKMQILEMQTDGDKSLIFFNEPIAIRGTAFLTHTHKKGSDDQWLYLPDLKRIKRIASNNRSGSFMGTEFSYEDVAPHETSKYEYKYIKDEKIGDLNCYVVELYPKDPNSGYSKLVLWYDKDELRRQKTEFFDKKGMHTKTLFYRNYQKFLGRLWYSLEFYIVNHITEKSTKLIWSKLNFKNGLTERDFDSKALYRVNKI